MQHSGGCGDSLGFINKLYYSPTYGKGAHTNVVTSNGDFTLRYTIDVVPPIGTGGIEPGDGCNDNLGAAQVTASGSLNTFPPTKAIDNDFSTYWWSPLSLNPNIVLDLGAQRPLCTIQIAWQDGNSHPYKFNIAVSKDGTNYVTAFSGSSSGTTTLPETYGLGGLEGRYVKITVTQSISGSTNSMAKISEIDLFGIFTGNNPVGPGGSGVVEH